MARTRAYSIVFQNIAVTAVQDLLSLLSTSGMAIELHGFVIGQITNASQQNLNISVKRLPVTATVGSGGAAVTPRKALSGDAAATATARRNDTSQMTTSGTVEVLHADVFNTLNGISHWWPPEDRPVISVSQGVSLSLDTAPLASMSVSGSLYFAELL